MSVELGILGGLLGGAFLGLTGYAQVHGKEPFNLEFFVFSILPAAFAGMTAGMAMSDFFSGFTAGVAVKAGMEVFTARKLAAPATPANPA